MQMITWVILPVLCVIAVAVYLYRKVKAAVKCFLPAYSFKRQRIFAGIISLLLIIPAVRIYGIWFIILLHFTVFLLLLDAVVFLIKKLKKQNLFQQKVSSHVWRDVLCGGMCRSRIIHDRINPGIADKIQILVFIND